MLSQERIECPQLKIVLLDLGFNFLENCNRNLAISSRPALQII